MTELLNEIRVLVEGDLVNTSRDSFHHAVEAGLADRAAASAGSQSGCRWLRELRKAMLAEGLTVQSLRFVR